MGGQKNKRWRYLALVMVLCLVVGAAQSAAASHGNKKKTISALVGSRMLKKQFEKAGITA